MLNADIAVAKVAKYAVRESGDSVEVVERPRGGISVVIADGQRSGRSAKAISNIAVRKAISLLAEGVRDGAVARAAHDYLRTQRGQVTAEMIIISIDLETRTLVISRNSRVPVLLREPGVGEAALREAALGGPGAWRALDEPSDVVGVHAGIRPVIVELPLAAGQVVVAFTDGLPHAGDRRNLHLDPLATAAELAESPAPGPHGGAGTRSARCTAQELAEGLLARALALDEDRPGDDTTVAVVCISEIPDPAGPQVRRMGVSFPVPAV